MTEKPGAGEEQFKNINALGISFDRLDAILAAEGSLEVSVAHHLSPPDETDEEYTQKKQLFYDEINVFGEKFGIDGDNWPEAFISGKARGLYERPIKYSDVVFWQRDFQTLGKTIFEVGYWTLPMEDDDEVHADINMDFRANTGHVLCYSIQGHSWTTRTYTLSDGSKETVVNDFLEGKEYEESDYKIGVGIKFDVKCKIMDQTIYDAEQDDEDDTILE